MILKRQWLQKVVKPMKIDNFKFGQSTRRSGVVEGKTAKDNLEKLSALKLPEQATRAEIREYVLKIHQISFDQSSRSRDDPQIGMLSAVGSENLDILIELLPSHDYYTQSAIKVLAGEKDKELILKNLACLPDLIEVVTKHGWEQDAKETLLEELKVKEYLPAKWIQAVAGFEDPDTYPDLISFLVNGLNRDETYRIIKNLPGINLKDAVSAAWSKVKYTSHTYACREMIPTAMEYGILESLDFAARALLDDPEIRDHEKRSLKNAISRHVGQFDADEAFREWLEANQGTITFDPESKIFSGTQLPAPQPEAPSAE